MSPVKKALHASSDAAWRTLLIITSISASALPLWKPIIPMFQHALLSCLKWISGSSLVFRPSSSANLNHLGGMTVTPVAAWEQREWITRREQEWKERLLFQEANHHRSFEHRVTSWAVLLFFFSLSSVPTMRTAGNRRPKPPNVWLPVASLDLQLPCVSCHSAGVKRMPVTWRGE